MNDIEIIKLEETIEGLWPKITVEQMGVVTRKAKCYELDQAIRLLSKAAEGKIFPSDLVPKLCAVFGGKTGKIDYTPVYALHPSGKHCTCNFVVNDPEHAKNSMKLHLVDVIRLYSWETDVVDFDIYVGRENFEKYHHARCDIETAKQVHNRSVTLTPVKPEESRSKPVRDTDDTGAGMSNPLPLKTAAGTVLSPEQLKRINKPFGVKK